PAPGPGPPRAARRAPHAAAPPCPAPPPAAPGPPPPRRPRSPSPCSLRLLLRRPAPLTRAAAGLRHELDVGDRHRAVQPLDHVDDVERRDAHRRQRLHLHPGPVRGAHGRADRHAVVLDDDVDTHPVHPDDVRERQQLGGALRGGDPGDPGDGEDVPLGHVPLPQRADELGRAAHPAARGRGAHRRGLLRDVDHPGVAALVQVGEAHGPSVSPFPAVRAGPWSRATRGTFGDPQARARSYSEGMPLPPLCDPGPPLSRDEVLRYSRHLLLEQLGDLGQRRLRAARVLVMGAGGLGSPILHYLAAAGVGQVGIVDDDVVEATNLQRQVIHTSADVGRPKVESAAEHVRALNADVDVVTHQVRLDATNAREVLGRYDLVLDGTDNFPTRYLVADVCAELGVPLVWGSILRFDAQVAVFWSRPPEGSGYPAVTLRDLFPAPPPPGATPSCGQAGVLGAMCGQVGSLMAAEAVKLVTGVGEPLLGRVAVHDVLAARWSELPLRPRPAPAPPATRAQLGYDPLGVPVTAHAAAVLAAE